MSCPHENFNGEMDVNRLEDSGRFVVDVRVQCGDCNERFVFIGLDVGASLERPMMSFGGHEAHLPVKPASEALPEWFGATGFGVR